MQPKTVPEGTKIDYDKDKFSEFICVNCNRTFIADKDSGRILCGEHECIKEHGKIVFAQTIMQRKKIKEMKRPQTIILDKKPDKRSVKERKREVLLAIRNYTIKNRKELKGSYPTMAQWMADRMTPTPRVILRIFSSWVEVIKEVKKMPRPFVYTLERNKEIKLSNK